MEKMPKYYRRNEHPKKNNGLALVRKRLLHKKTKHVCNTAVLYVMIMKNAEGLKASQAACSYRTASQRQQAYKQ
jgi:hypothetical protein